MCKEVLLELAGYAIVIAIAMVIFAVAIGMTPQHLTIITLFGLIALLVFGTIRRRKKKDEG